ncbi:saccharopine dehydrogenase-like oxidoreductase [Daktulosphaira vitifoliae]|uniref:saccharopine dehydrogenase-like oxidoreductase n=1 Tax=Daktulosphaira vitifoliae TaxID=58002 RepID=UPI0021AAA33F|nr:saccharopine dehydrogenase-like oxidoreductase [Daktulosphaira vitifoliae]
MDELQDSTKGSFPNESSQSSKSITAGKRQYDIVLLGASGYTGKHVLKEMGPMSQKYLFTWAVAGRNKKKLQKVLDDMYNDVDGYSGDKNIDIIDVDVETPESVQLMTASTSVVINCVGPYYMYGEIVVKSCVLKGTHYVDVTAESLFMDKMVYNYNNEAEKSGSVIVNALGLESVPADLGVEYLFQKFNGNLQTIDVYMKLYRKSCSIFRTSAILHDNTYTSALLHLATKKERLQVRKLLDESMGINTRPIPNVTKILHKQNIDGALEWCVPFPEPDQSVITRSLHHAKMVEKRNVNCHARCYWVMNLLIIAIFGLFVYVLLSLMVKITSMINIFTRFPRIFTLGIASQKGPDELFNEDSRMSLTIIGRGTTSGDTLINENDASRITKVKVSANSPGYGFTSKSVVLGAVTLLKDNIPKGGVLTPASAFRKTNFLNRLVEHEAAKFELISDTVNY